MDKSKRLRQWKAAKLWSSLAVASAMTFISGTAFAGTTPTSSDTFFSLYNLVISWVSGAPGIIGAIVILIVGVYGSMFAGKSPMYFFGAALGAALIFLLPGIATTMAGAVF